MEQFEKGNSSRMIIRKYFVSVILLQKKIGSKKVQIGI